MTINLTSNRKGEIAVFKTETRALELGYIPCRPSVICRYDTVLDDGRKLWRVQVKYADRKPGNSDGAVIAKLAYETRTKHVFTYRADEVDALVVYIPKIDQLCWFPPEIFVGRTELCIRFVPSKNCQQKGVLFANNYFW